MTSMPSTTSPRRPFVEGGGIVVDGVIRGGWFVDRFDPVAVDGMGDRACLWVGERHGRDAVAGHLRMGSGGDPPVQAVTTVGDRRWTEERTFHQFLHELHGLGRHTHPKVGSDGGAEGAPMGAPSHIREDVRLLLAADVAAALEAMAPFLDGLDPEARVLAVEVASRLGTNPVDRMGVYGALDRTFEPEASLARAWRWHPRLTRASTCLWSERRDEFLAAVAAGPDAYARILGRRLAESEGSAPRSHVASMLRAERILGRLTAAEAEALFAPSDPATGYDELEDLCSDLAPYPASWWPRTVADWERLMPCHPAIGWAGACAAPGAEPRLADVRGDWSGFAGRLARAHGQGGGHRALRQALWDVSDVTDAFARQVVQGASLTATGRTLEDDRATNAAAVALWSGRGLVRILELSRTWHARQQAMDAALPSTPATSSWPACLPDAAIGDVTVTVLTDRGALAAEGSRGPDRDGVEGLGHCVGGYSWDCLSGASRILSIRGRDGARLSTAEVAWRQGALTVLQHRGRSNAEPPASAVAALDAYARRLAGDDLRASSPRLPVLAVAHPGIEVCGYDWRVEGAWATVADIWRPFLPRRLRVFGADDVARIAAGVDGHSSAGWWTPEGPCATSPASYADAVPSTPAWGT